MTTGEQQAGTGEGKRNGVFQRVYLVFLPATPDTKNAPPEDRIFAVKLSLRGAQEAMALVPGSYYQKSIATK